MRIYRDRESGCFRAKVTQKLSVSLYCCTTDLREPPLPCGCNLVANIAPSAALLFKLWYWWGQARWVGCRPDTKFFVRYSSSGTIKSSMLKDCILNKSARSRYLCVGRLFVELLKRKQRGFASKYWFVCSSSSWIWDLRHFIQTNHILVPCTLRKLQNNAFLIDLRCSY